MSPRPPSSSVRLSARLSAQRDVSKGEEKEEEGREEGEKGREDEDEVGEEMEGEGEVVGRERLQFFQSNVTAVVTAQSAVRRFLATEKVKEMRKRLRHCQNVVNEIVQTEGAIERMSVCVCVCVYVCVCVCVCECVFLIPLAESYVSSLAACIDVFLVPLESAVKTVEGERERGRERVDFFDITFLEFRLTCICLLLFPLPLLLPPSPSPSLSPIPSPFPSFSFSLSLDHFPSLFHQSKPILSEEEIRFIFSDIKNIHFFHTVMLADLVTRTKAWGHRSRIGDVFLKLMQCMNVYTMYVQNYSRSMHTLGVCQRREGFAGFLREARK